MHSQKVILDIAPSGIANLILNRPAVRNAFDQEMIASLIDAIAQAQQDPEVKVLVLRANGRNFSAGADLNWMANMAKNSPAENLADAQQLAALMSGLNQMTKPSIAIVQGAAYGGALGLIACCDMVFASADSSFCLSEVKLGLIPAVISPYVVRAIGERQARRYCISAEVFSAQTAQRLGLVHEIAATAEELKSLSEQWLGQLLNNGPLATQAAKKLIMDVSQQPIDADLVLETARRIADIRATEEAREGLSAFLEKRRPRWQ